MSKQNKLSAGLEHATLIKACFIYVLGSRAIEAISVTQKPS